ncbi:hypothetical protein CEXT_29031 [Caerostris extrusa]|uniref:Uncharacterized protein n=1 Tax=Caerostris extrusa TaxID=172846 RepID=A0AAV4U0R8_CAEEX|nr:hypothetical protein CEXT_29031 [Caerostris extrusa]
MNRTPSNAHKQPFEHEFDCSTPPTLEKIPSLPEFQGRRYGQHHLSDVTPASSWRRRDAGIGPPSIQFGESMCSGRARDYRGRAPRARAHP